MHVFSVEGSLMIEGSLVALVTPMQENGAVDEDALARLIDFHLENETDGIVSVGTTGESATLDFPEHCAVIRKTVELVKGRIPVIAGTGANSTTEAIALTECAKEAGADAALLVTPYYNKPTQEGLYLHHKAIAQAVDIPQILYNVPGRTACDLLPETVGRLAEVEGIVGLKDATGDLARVARHRELCGDEFALYSGDDASAREFLLRGGQGVITVTGNVAPRGMHLMTQAACSGNAELAAEFDSVIEGLHRDLFLESNPIPVKWALYEMQLIGPAIRLPLTPLAPQYRAHLRTSLESAGIVLQGASS